MKSTSSVRTKCLPCTWFLRLVLQASFPEESRKTVRSTAFIPARMALRTAHQKPVAYAKALRQVNEGVFWFYDGRESTHSPFLCEAP